MESFKSSPPIPMDDGGSTVRLDASAVRRESPWPEELTSDAARYELLAQIGGGGFGSVHLAKAIPTDPDSAIPEFVAMKLYHGAIREDSKPLLKREVSALKAIDHPRVTPVYDWCFADPCPFMVMRFYDQGTLVSYMHSPLEIEMGWLVLRHVLEGLVVVHRASLLHLDIKPSNILIDTDSGFVLGDLGLSQTLMASREAASPGFGTGGFRAPEQIRFGTCYDTRTDLYGVGATMWALLSGINPSRPPEDLADRLAESNLPQLGTFRPDLPYEMHRIVMAMLAPDPVKRPGSAAEVLAWVSASMEGGSIDISDISEYDHLPPHVQEEGRQVIDSLLDPVWGDILRARDMSRALQVFDDGDVLAHEGEDGHRAFVLLGGSVIVSRRGTHLRTEQREGTFLGEVATLANLPRWTTKTASGRVWVLALNAAELEALAAGHPALAVRLMKLFAERLGRERTRPKGSDTTPQG